MKIFIALIFSVFLVSNASALELKAAREKGLVGETAKGFIASVKASASPEVAALIKKINKKRTAHFKKIAAKNKSPLETVQSSAHKKILKKLKKGQLYQNVKGAWIKK